MEKLLIAEYDNLGLWYIVSFVCGIALYFILPSEIAIYHISFILSACLILVVITQTHYIIKVCSLLVLCCCLGVTVGKIRYITYNVCHISDKIKSKVVGKVKRIIPAARGVIIHMTNCNIQELNNVNLLPSINVFAASDKAANIQIGDNISLNATLHPPTDQSLVHQLSSDILAYFSGISAIGYNSSNIVILPRQNKDCFTTLTDNIEHLRMKIYDRIIEQMDSFLGGFVNAIILGEGYALNKSITNAMRDAGVSHILCISGLHLSLVATILFRSTRFILNLSPRVAFAFNTQVIAIIISSIGSFGYLLLAGSHIAAVRAFIMTFTAMMIIILRRGVISLRLVGLSAIIILLLNPEYILHPSFQLSFIAVIALIAGYKRYDNYKQQNKALCSPNFLAKVKEILYLNLYSSIIASTATMPITILHFYKFANYAILANLLIIPILAFWVMPLTLISVMLIAVDLDGYVLPLVALGVEAIIQISQRIAGLPYAVTYWGKIDNIDLFLYLLGFFWLVIWQQWWKMLGIAFISAAIIKNLLTPRPDLTIDNYNMLLVIKENNQKIRIYGGKLDVRLVNYWSNRYGQEEILCANIAIEDSNHKIVTNSNKSIILRFNEQSCPHADLIISALEIDNYHHQNVDLFQSNLKLSSNISYIEAFCYSSGCKYQITYRSRFFS